MADAEVATETTSTTVDTKTKDTDETATEKETAEAKTEATTEEATTEVTSNNKPKQDTPVGNITPATEAPATEASKPEAPKPATPAPEPTTEAHKHDWVTVVDKEAWDEPVYEEEVVEWHSYWPDGTMCDELADCGAKARWCSQHCVTCFSNCPAPDPAGRRAWTVYTMSIVVGTNKVQVSTTHHDAVTHQECNTCGARQ